MVMAKRNMLLVGWRIFWLMSNGITPKEVLHVGTIVATVIP
jgi:hypothetical protein